MTLRTWPIDVTPDATALSTANLKATDGTAAALISGGSGGTIRSTTANVHDGAAALRTASGTTQSLDVRFPFAANTQGAVSLYRYIASLLAITPIVIRDTAGTGLVRIAINSTGKVLIQSGSGTTRATSAASITEGRWNRIEILFDIGGSSTTGSCTVNVYNGNATGTPDVTVTCSGVDLGGTGANSAGFLSVGALLTAAATQDWDTIQTNDGATAMIGPYSTANIPPTLALSSNQDVAAGANVTVNATASDPDGTIASYAWTVSYSSAAAPALTGASTASVSFTAPAAGNLVILQCVVTDSNGATTTKTTEVRVPTSTDFTTLPMGGSGDAWTNVGSAATGGAALADTDDTTYVESPTLGGTASARRWRLQPLTARSALTLTSRSELTALGGTVKVRLREGATAQTLRQEWDVTQGTSWTDQALVVTTPGAIADWGDLWVEYSVAA